MYVDLKDGKTKVPELKRLWDRLLEHGGLSLELQYRIGKLGRRLDFIADKMYLKTVKATAIVTVCYRNTETLIEQLTTNDPYIYSQLTELEQLFEDLLKKTYEFRIKAG